MQQATIRHYIHSSSTSGANEPRPGGPTQGHSAAVLAPMRCSKTAQDQNQAANQRQLLESILSNRHLSKYDRYLYATAISIAYLGCLRAGEVSYPSTNSFHPKQHLISYKGHHHSPEHGTATAQKQQNRSIQERGHYNYCTKQTKHLPSADHKAVPRPQEACTQIRCNIPSPRMLSAYKTKTPSNDT